MKKIAVLLLAASFVSVWAQAPRVVGKFGQVKGLVTVATGDLLSNATVGAPLVVGSRIVATSSGAVRLDFDSGCDVTLQPNESITIGDNQDCKALLASVVPVNVPVAVAAGGALSDFVPGLLLGVAAMGVVVADNNANKDSGS